MMTSQFQPVTPVRPVAVITGAAQGIGFLTAKSLSSTHRIALLDVKADSLPQAAAACGDDAIYADCDITQQDQVEAAVAKVVEQAGGVDVVVSNAGIAIGGVLRFTDPDAIAALLSVNITGNWRIIKACLPHIIERRGYVLGVASIAAVLAVPVEGAYCASKAGLEMLLDVLRLEVEHLGVDVGVAYFTFHNTEMVRDGDRLLPEFTLLRISQPWPLNKMYPPEMAADAVVAAIRGRRRRVFSPGWAAWLSRLRMVLRTRAASSANLKLIPKIDKLTAARAATKGEFAAAMSDSPASKAAAASVGRHIA